jgi:hypothetical protein
MQFAASSWIVSSDHPQAPRPPPTFQTLSDAKHYLCQQLECAMADLPTYKLGGAPCNDAADIPDAGLYTQPGNEGPIYGLFEIFYF